MPQDAGLALIDDLMVRLEDDSKPVLRSEIIAAILLLSGRLHHAERQQRIDAAIAKQLSDALAENFRLTEHLAEAKSEIERIKHALEQSHGAHDAQHGP